MELDPRRVASVPILSGRTEAASHERPDEHRWDVDFSSSDVRRWSQLNATEKAMAVRLLVVHVGSEEHVVVLNVHHIATDGWSNPRVLRDVSVALRGGFTP